jgi:transcription elongation factor Elf1
MGLFGKKNKNEDVEEETEEEEETKNTYDMDFECENCGDEESYEIPMGTTLKKFLKGKICENCGCPILSENE